MKEKLTQKELDGLRERAWSFRGFTPPNGAKKVAEEIRNGELYEYYIDTDKNVWYETTTSREWKKKISFWERKNKKH